LTAVALAFLVRRHWGAPALAGSGRSAATVIVALAVAVMVGDLVTHGRDLSGLGAALANGLLAGVLALVAGLFVVIIGDRQGVLGAVKRGRQRRGRS